MAILPARTVYFDRRIALCLQYPSAVEKSNLENRPWPGAFYKASPLGVHRPMQHPACIESGGRRGHSVLSPAPATDRDPVPPRASRLGRAQPPPFPSRVWGSPCGGRGEVVLVKLGLFLVLAEHLRGAERPAAKLGPMDDTARQKTKEQATRAVSGAAFSKLPRQAHGTLYAVKNGGLFLLLYSLVF